MGTSSPSPSLGTRGAPKPHSVPRGRRRAPPDQIGASPLRLPPSLAGAQSPAPFRRAAPCAPLAGDAWGTVFLLAEAISHLLCYPYDFDAVPRRGRSRAAALGLVSVTHSIETPTTSGNSDVRGLSTLDIVVFCILAGVVSTFASGYTYGQINQVEHLPMMFRMVDSEYLRGDFFVDSTTEFNPRFYYIALMAILAQVVSPPVLFLLLTCVANALIDRGGHVVRRSDPVGPF